jgi:hypothetical protein
MSQVDPKWLKRGLVAAWANGERVYTKEGAVDLRELDAAVHERVMGEPLKRGPLIAVVPHYSVDLRAAFEVVERLRGEGWRVEMGSAGECWRTTFARRATSSRTSYRPHVVVERHAETLPLAIVTAALATREGE